MLGIGTIVMGVDELHRAVAFWTQALGYVPEREVGPDDDFMILVPLAGDGAHLALDVSETPVQRYPRVHLDLYAGGAQAAEVERLLSLGGHPGGLGSVPGEPRLRRPGRHGGQPLLRHRHRPGLTASTQGREAGPVPSSSSSASSSTSQRSPHSVQR